MIIYFHVSSLYIIYFLLLCDSYVIKCNNYLKTFNYLSRHDIIGICSKNWLVLIFRYYNLERGVIWTLLNALRATIPGFIIEGVIYSILDMVGAYVDFLICHVSEITFKTA